jgi:multiple sugar transport system ATP-binding protein
MSNNSKLSVELKDIRIAYGIHDVIKKLNLGIAPGEFVVLLGPSGCGKSSLLNAIAGLADISDGEIWISERNVTWEEPKNRGISMVFQSYALYPHMSVHGNLSFGLKVSGLKQAEIERRVEKAAKMLQIENLLERRPSQLSGGQRQRVAIGRALVREVDVFLFDEPLSNLDAKLRNELRIEIKKLHTQLGNTMIYVTHDQVEAMTLADRIAIMKGGEIQQLASPMDIYRQPANRFVAGFIGSPSMNFIDGQIFVSEAGPRFSAPGFDVDLKDYQAVSAIAACRATLGFRAEDVELAPADGMIGASVSGTVGFTETLGSDTIVWLKILDSVFSVRTDGRVELSIGDERRLRLDTTRLSLFDPESGVRL